VRTNVLLYAPTGGLVDDVRVSSGEQGVFSQTHDGLAVVGKTVQLKPGEQVVIDYDVLTGSGQPGLPVLRVTPVALEKTNGRFGVALLVIPATLDMYLLWSRAASTRRGGSRRDSEYCSGGRCGGRPRHCPGRRHGGGLSQLRQSLQFSQSFQLSQLSRTRVRLDGHGPDADRRKPDTVMVTGFDPGAAVTLKTSDGQVFTATANADGAASFTFTLSAAGTYTVQAFDAAGTLVSQQVLTAKPVVAEPVVAEPVVAKPVAAAVPAAAVPAAALPAAPHAVAPAAPRAAVPAASGALGATGFRRHQELRSVVACSCCWVLRGPVAKRRSAKVPE